MVEDAKQPSVPPLTAALAEQSLAEFAPTPQHNVEKSKPSDADVDLIGDSNSWPSLSESTRPSPPLRSAPATDSPIAAFQAPAIAHSAQNHINPNTNSTSNPNPNPNPNFPSNPNRQRSLGRSKSGRERASRSGFIRHPMPPQQLPLPPPPLPPPFFGFEGPFRGNFFQGNGFGAPHRPSDHQFQQSNSSHGGGVRPRGDGIHHYNHYNNAAPQGWVPQPGWPMGYLMPPQQLTPFPFIHGPFMGPPPYTGVPAQAPPLSPAPPPPPPPQSPVSLLTKLLYQINYYLSEENLVKDIYLRSKMDGGGWVPVDLIAGFKKVRDLTQDILLVRQSLGASTVVELQVLNYIESYARHFDLIKHIKFDGKVISGSFEGYDSEDEMLKSALWGGNDEPFDSKSRGKWEITHK